MVCFFLLFFGFCLFFTCFLSGSNRNAEKIFSNKQTTLDEQNLNKKSFNMIQTFICLLCLFEQKRCNARVNFKTSLKLEFFFSLTSCHTKVKKPILLYYLPIARRRKVGYISFLRFLTQTASSRVLICVNVLWQ